MYPAMVEIEFSNNALIIPALSLFWIGLYISTFINN